MRLSILIFLFFLSLLANAQSKLAIVDNAGEVFVSFKARKISAVITYDGRVLEAPLSLTYEGVADRDGNVFLLDDIKIIEVKKVRFGTVVAIPFRTIGTLLMLSGVAVSGITLAAETDDSSAGMLMLGVFSIGAGYVINGIGSKMEPLSHERNVTFRLDHRQKLKLVR